MRLLIMGPPGAGKGTQAAGIADHFGIPAISTGAIFRAHIAAGTPLGQEVEGLLARGEYVPDGTTNAIVNERLAEPDCAPGFLLDGYPRTLQQVRALDEFLGGRQERLDGVLALVADTDELVARLLRRAQIEGRADDDDATIRRRLGIYHRETEPLLGEYRRRGLLVEVDALGEIDAVAQRIYDALDRIAVD